MGNKKRDFDDIVKIFASPFIYYMINLFVQGAAFVVLFIRELKNINSEYSTYVASYSFVEKLLERIENNSYIIVFISALIGMLFFGRVYYKDCKIIKDFNMAKQLEFRNPKDIIIVIIFGAFAGTGLSRFVSLLPLDNVLGSYEDVSSSLIKGSLVLQIISIGIIVPITEELVYRGLLYNRLKLVTNIKLAAIITSVMFGIFHFNLLQGVYAGLLSFVLIYVMDLYKSIIPSILIHSSVNISALLGTYFGISDRINESMVAYILVMTVELIVAGLIFVICLVKDGVDS